MNAARRDREVIYKAKKKPRTREDARLMGCGFRSCEGRGKPLGPCARSEARRSPIAIRILIEHGPSGAERG